VLPGSGKTQDLIARMARFSPGDGSEGAVAVVPVPGGVVSILPTEGLDLEAAQRKLEAERSRLQSEIKRAQGKLGNEKFVAKAPPQLVEEERAKLERLEAELAAL
jgi:valyl-tRNA synthetase